MNIAICTTVGLVVIVAGAAAYVGVLFSLLKGGDYLSDKWPMPDWVTKIFVYAFVAAVVGFLLWAGHGVGCHVIHLAMNHH